ncbi:MAG: AAA family ATPase [Polyangiaceae bacterium]
MLKRVRLNRLRGFTEVDLEVAPITVLVGPNSSGKTSILRAVRLALEALSIGLEAGVASPEPGGGLWICHEVPVRDPARLFPVTDWSEIFTDRRERDAAITLDFEATDVITSVHVELTQGANVQLLLTVIVTLKGGHETIGRVLGRPAAEMREATFTVPEAEDLHDFVLAMAPRVIFAPAFYGVTGAEEYRTRASVNRSLGGGDQNRVVRNLLARLDPRAFVRLNEFLRMHIGARLVSQTAEHEIEDAPALEAYFRDTNGDLELSSAGTGLVSLVALRAMMEWTRPAPSNPFGDAPAVLYLLDEPEAHLHPKLQGDLAETLAALTRSLGAQTLIATHSVEMINRLARQPDVSLLSVDRARSTITRLDSETALVHELGRWCDLTPFASLNFLSSRKILFHEGPSDSALLQRCAEALFAARAPDLDAFRRWTLVSLNGVGNVKAQGVLGAVLSPAVFPALADQEVVRAVCVVDRDAERQPGFRVLPALSKDHFDAREMVWSRHSIECLFLEPNVLALWIRALLPGEPVSFDDLRTWAQDGIAQANGDQELLDDAEKALMLAHVKSGRRPGDALDEAKRMARAQPEIWQQGRGRARIVLAHIREHLPENRLKNALPATIQGLLEGASVDRLGDWTGCVPEQIRELLEYMAK